MPQQPKVLVTGAGGFIGHHLINYLVDRIGRANAARQDQASQKDGQRNQQCPYFHSSINVAESDFCLN